MTTLFDDVERLPLELNENTPPPPPDHLDVKYLAPVRTYEDQLAAIRDLDDGFGWWKAAVHESGHAAAAYILGIGLKEVILMPLEEGARPSCHLYPAPSQEALWEEIAYQAEFGGFVNGRTRRWVEKRVMCALAGGLTWMAATGMADTEGGTGERMTLQEREDHGRKSREEAGMLGSGGRGDYETAFDYVAQISGGEDETGAYLAWLEERTRNLLLHPRFLPAVKGLAQELLFCEFLSGKEARQVMSAACEKEFNTNVSLA